jgi:hypothetical protein
VEKISIWIKNFALAFDVGLLPVGFDFGAVGERNSAEALLSAIQKVAFVNGGVIVEVLAPAIFFALDPEAFVLVLIGVPHGALAFLDVIFPLAFVHITIGIAIPAPALFAVFNATFIRLAIFEDVCAVNELVFKPCSEVNIPRWVHVKPHA